MSNILVKCNYNLIRIHNAVTFGLHSTSCMYHLDMNVNSTLMQTTFFPHFFMVTTPSVSFDLSPQV
jgi:hypothetical protein